MFDFFPSQPLTLSDLDVAHRYRQTLVDRVYGIGSTNAFGFVHRANTEAALISEVAPAICFHDCGDDLSGWLDTEAPAKIGKKGEENRAPRYNTVFARSKKGARSGVLYDFAVFNFDFSIAHERKNRAPHADIAAFIHCLAAKKSVIAISFRQNADTLQKLRSFVKTALGRNLPEAVKNNMENGGKEWNCARVVGAAIRTAILKQDYVRSIACIDSYSKTDLIGDVSHFFVFECHKDDIGPVSEE